MGGEIQVAKKYIIGTDNNETLIGTELDEVIDAGIGNDVLDGGAGNDILLGGAGNDILKGDDGDDLLDGELGADRIYAGIGNDRIIYDAADAYIDGGAGEDTLDASRYGTGINIDLNLNGKFAGIENVIGGNGNDVIKGTQASEKLQAGSGNDIIDGGAGDDLIAGGAGLDQYIFKGNFGHDTIESNKSNFEDTIVLDKGVEYENLIFEQQSNDLIIRITDANGAVKQDDDILLKGYFSKDINGDADANYKLINFKTGSGKTFKYVQGDLTGENIRSSNGDDIIKAADNNDYIYASGGRDKIYAAGGDDTIIYDAVDLYVDGGEGTDTLDATEQKVAVTIDLNNLKYKDIEKVYGGWGADKLKGTALGEEVLVGGAGNDILDGGGGNNVLSGGDGADQYLFNLLNNTIGSTIIKADESNEQDTIVFGKGIEKENLRFSRLDDNLIINVVNANGDLSGDIQLQNYFAIAGDYKIKNFKTGSGKTFTYTMGTEDTDFILSNGTNDIIDAASGDDTIDSGAGDDIINAGAGDDFIRAGDGIDILNGEAGADILLGGAGNDILDGGAGADVLDGGLGNDKIYAGADDDRIIYDAADIYLDGGSGVDILDATNQVRPVVIDLTNTTKYQNIEIVKAGTGNDTIKGYGEQQELYGGAGNDTIYSNNEGVAAEQIILNGEAGNDTLYLNGAGNLIGGMGNDTYIIGGVKAGTVITLDDQGELDEVNKLAFNGTLANLRSTEVEFESYGADLKLNINSATLLIKNWSNNPLANITFRDKVVSNKEINTLLAEQALVREVHANEVIATLPRNERFKFAGEFGLVTIEDIASDDILDFSAYTDGEYGPNMLKIADDLQISFSKWDDDNDTGILVGTILLKGYFSNDTATSGIMMSMNSSKEGKVVTARVLVGSTGADLNLQGTTESDFILGGDGDDIIYGGAGNDFITGDWGDESPSSGDDNLYGGDGDDELWDDHGTNELYGGNGNDNLSVDKVESNKLYGEAGNDVLEAWGNNNLLDGGDGDDALLASGENNMLKGGSGNDTLTVEHSGNLNNQAGTLEGGLGIDTYVLKESSLYNVVIDNRTDNSLKDILKIENDANSALSGDFLYLLVANDLKLKHRTTGNEITIAGWKTKPLSKIVFADRELSTAQINTKLNSFVIKSVNPGQNITANVGDNEKFVFKGLFGDVSITDIAINDALDFSSYKGGDYGPSFERSGADLKLVFNKWENDSATKMGSVLLKDCFASPIAGELGFIMTNPSTGIAVNSKLIIGTDGNDANIIGTAGVDYIMGAHGDDVIHGGAGNDMITGDWGDEISATGNDELYGDDGDDMIWDDHGVNKMYGGNGNDTIVADGVNNNELYGQEGNDKLEAWGNSNLLEGDNGHDQLLAVGAYNSLNGGAGNDTLTISGRQGGILAGTMTGGKGSDTYIIKNLAGCNVIIDNSSNDTGTDILKFKGETIVRVADFSYTLLERDLQMKHEATGEIVTIQGWLDKPLTQIVFADKTLTTAQINALANLKVATGVAEVFSFKGNFENTVIKNIGGTDTIDFSSYISGDCGPIFKRDNQNLIMGMHDWDDASDDYQIMGEIKFADYFNNPTNFSVKQFDAETGKVLTSKIMIGSENNETINGSAGADYILGASGDDIIYGGAGNDIITGDWGDESPSAGNDKLHGGAGNDYLWDDYGQNELYGGDGNDDLMVENTYGNKLYGEAGNDRLEAWFCPYPDTQYTTGHLLDGGSGDDELLAWGKDHKLYGGSGNDKLVLHDAGHYGGMAGLLNGGAGNDQYFVALNGAGDKNITVENAGGLITDIDKLTLGYSVTWEDEEVATTGVDKFTFNKNGTDLTITTSNLEGGNSTITVKDFWDINNNLAVDALDQFVFDEGYLQKEDINTAFNTGNSNIVFASSDLKNN